MGKGEVTKRKNINHFKTQQINNMKQVLTLLFLFTSTLLNAQPTPQSAPKVPEKQWKEKGTLWVNDTLNLIGTIWYTARNNNKVEITTTDGNIHKYKAKEIKGFAISSVQWFSKPIKEAGLGDNNYFLNLVSPSSDKIKKYDLHEQSKSGTMSGNTPVFEYTKSIYVEIPGENRLVFIGDTYFMPFHKKMAEIVKDCPELAKKIEDKEKDYKVNKVFGIPQNFDKVVLKVVDEYNACATTTHPN